MRCVKHQVGRVVVSPIPIGAVRTFDQIYVGDGPKIERQMDVVLNEVEFEVSKRITTND